MSARSAFLPSKAAPQKPSQGGRGLNGNDATTNSNSNGRDAPSALALRDASNSFRPTSQTSIDSSLTKSSLEASKDNTARNFAGIDKPLNTSGLIRPKNKKGGENAAGSAKNSRLSNAERMKENDPNATVHSPRSRPMSPSRVPKPSALAPSLMITRQETLLTTSDSRSPPHLHVTQISETSQTHSVNDTFKNPSFAHPTFLPSASPFSSVTGTSHSALLSPRARPETLDPAKREVFPLLMQQEAVDLTQGRDSMSPPLPGQEYMSGGHQDYQVPIDKLDAADQRDREHRLRRTTKRLNMHGDTEDVGSASKRSKVDVRSKQVSSSQ